MMLKCSKEAFAACPDRHLCGCPEEAVFAEGSECDEFNRQIRSHTMTHGDQIRAMSDEELYLWAKKQIGCGFDFFPCGVVCDGKCESYSDKDCKTKIMNWLRQPAEVSCDG